MSISHETLVASTVTTVTVTQRNINTVSVVFHEGTGPVYFTIDGSTPTVEGDDTYAVSAFAPVRVVGYNGVDDVTVKLISATADLVEVAVEGQGA